MHPSLPRDSARDDRLLRQYLLGALSDEETERLDEQSVVDDDFADRLRIAEDDLIDAYVSDTLNADCRQRFESHYLASPRRRAKVAFAARLLKAVDAAARAQSARPGDQPIARSTVAARFVPWAFAAAASLLLVTGVLLARDMRLSREAQAAFARAADATRRADDLTHQLADQQTAARAANQASAAARPVQAPSGVALVLIPETRGVGPVPIVAIEPESTSVPLDLRVETADAPSYEVSLKDPESNRTVWHDRAERAADAGRSSLVSVRVPAALLNAQHYSLDLFAVRGGRRAEFLATYAFEVVRR